MMKKKNGILLTFEGGEGGGKTTQVTRLKERLTKLGHDVIALREPGGTVISEQIRAVVLSNKNIGMAFTTEVLLFQAARAQIYREIVIPSLSAGKIVLMDRSRDSSVVYQGVVRGFGSKLIESLNKISTKNTYPDITLLLDVPVKVGLKRRIQTGEINRLDMENIDFHQQVRTAYLDLANKSVDDRWVIINANQSLTQVEKQIWQAVSIIIK